MISLNESILNNSLLLAQQQLQGFAQSENFWTVFDSVFGTEYARAQAEAIQQVWQVGDFSQLPEIQVLDSASMPGIQGGFSAETGKIYINADFLVNATADQIAAVLLEEIGHSLDNQINTSDTPGDEGELFSAFVTGQSLTDTALERIHTENDQRTITVNDANVDIESASGNYGFLGKQVEYQYVFPSFNSNSYLGYNARSTVIEPPEFTGLFNYFVVDVDANQITVTLTDSVNWTGNVEFNGFRITDFSGVVSPITGVTDNSSKVTTTFDPNNIYINWAGAFFAPGETFVVNVNFANEAPSGSSKTLTTNEDTTYTFTVSDFGFSDIDGNTFNRVRITTVPTAGSLTLNGLAVSAATFVNVSDITAGNLKFTPALNSNGNSYTSFTFQVEDNGGTASGGANLDPTPNTIMVNVAPVNDAPIVANAITDQSATEDTTFSFTIPADTFSDVDGDILIYSATLVDGSGLPSWLTFDATTRTFSGTPVNEDVGAISVRVTASDGQASVSDVFSLAIANTNDAPVVANAITNQSATEDAAFSFTIPDGTFADVDGDNLTYAASLENGNPLPSWLTFNAATQTFSGTPENGDVGTISVRVSASDGQVSVNNVFSLAIANTNDAPVVANAITNQSATEDAAFNFTIPNNTFADVDGDSLTYTASLENGDALPSWLSFNATTKTFSGTPVNEDVGTISVQVTASDGQAVVSNVFSLAIANTNDAPSLTDIPAALIAGTEDTAYTINAADLLQGFSDVDGDSLSVSDLSASNGSLVKNNNDTYAFTPAANFNGILNLSYNVVDGNGGSIAATQSFTVNAVNDVPTGSSTATLINGTEDTTYTIKATDLLQGFSDVDGDSLSVSDLTASNGSLVKNNNDTYAFTPAANFNGTVNLSYNVVDGNGGSVAATQSFTVAAVNDIPTGTASATLINGTEDTSYTINAADLLQGFSDVDGDSLSVSDLSASNGSLVKNNNSTYTFIPAANFNGTVNLSYNVVDGQGGSTPATQFFTLAAVNDAPTGSATASLVAGTEDTAYTISQSDLLTGFSDVDGDTLSVSNLTASNGSLVNNNNGTWSFTSAANYNGAVNLSYNVTDGNSGSTEATQSFTLAAVNDTPTAINESLTTAEDVPLVISAATLLGNDADIDLGDSLSIAAVTQPSKGGLVNNGNGTYTFTPNANYNGTDSFTYTISDRAGATSTATVNLTVNAVNDNPDAVSDIVTARQGTPKTILAAELLANDTDVEGNTLSLTNVSNAQNGTVALDSNGNVVFTANTNASTASFEYTLSDGNGGTDSASVTLLVGKTLNGGNGTDPLSGTAGDDILNGGNGNDTLLGLAGDDILSGGNGIDNLQGGEGKDRLYGGRGNDLLTGGIGSDIFVLMTQSGTDTIQDFADGEDKIGLAGGLTFGQLTIGSSNGNTLISKNGGEVLAILADVNSSLITQADFISVM